MSIETRSPTVRHRRTFKRLTSFSSVASHIRPYKEDGPHEVANGVLLRADLHRLFDKGYVTVTPDLRLAVSARLREEFDNGRSYYPLHGREVRPPQSTSLRPSPEFIRWHNEHVFLG